MARSVDAVFVTVFVTAFVAGCAAAFAADMRVAWAFGSAFAIIMTTASRARPVRRAISSGSALRARSARVGTLDTGVDTRMVLFDPDVRGGRVDVAWPAGIDFMPSGVNQRRNPLSVDGVMAGTLLRGRPRQIVSNDMATTSSSNAPTM